MCNCNNEICGSKCPCMCHPVQDVYDHILASKETKK